MTAQDLSKILRVASITLSVVTTTRDKQVRATVRVTDAAGNVVPGATVSGTFSGVAASSATASSDASGNAILSSKRFRKSGTVTFTVTGITKSGSTYDAARNAVSAATIVVP